MLSFSHSYLWLIYEPLMSVSHFVSARHFVSVTLILYLWHLFCICDTYFVSVTLILYLWHLLCFCDTYFVSVTLNLYLALSGTICATMSFCTVCRIPSSLRMESSVLSLKLSWSMAKNRLQSFLQTVSTASS